jgi:hypothetical protein
VRQGEKLDTSQAVCPMCGETYQYDLGVSSRRWFAGIPGVKVRCCSAECAMEHEKAQDDGRR